jgi:hypothetical protein
MSLILYAIAIVILGLLAPLLIVYGRSWGETFRVRMPESAAPDQMPSQIRDLLQPWIDELIDRDFQILNYQLFDDSDRIEPFDRITSKNDCRRMAGSNRSRSTRVDRPASS